MVGKGAAYARADGGLRGLVDAAGLPFLATAMGRGVVSDSHPSSVQAARSAALRGADVVLVVGARWETQQRVWRALIRVNMVILVHHAPDLCWCVLRQTELVAALWRARMGISAKKPSMSRWHK